MKTSRIFPYYKTEGEQRHEVHVKKAKANRFKHPGSKSGYSLYIIAKNNNKA
uniref:Uncharacterized protein n=1 Tax=Geladintestivirus 5 TaxID=3233137 RepID=A0AAU8MHB1_9CAUD